MSDRQENSLEGRHIASLTNSQMIVVDLQQLQSMGIFTYEVALLEQSDTRIYAYEHGSTQNGYLVVIPLPFFESQKSRPFVDLLCVGSQTVTVPVKGGYVQQVEGLLQKFRLVNSKKRGNRVIKLYIEGDCWTSYLDFVTYQGVQFSGRSCQELIAMKKQNAFQYCLNAFRQQLLPHVYRSEQDEVARALQICTTQLKEIYCSLACHQRFDTIYGAINPEGSTLRELLIEIEKVTLGRNVTTMGDEECEQLVNEQLSKMVNSQISSYSQQLKKMRKSEQQVFLTKIMHGILYKMRRANFDINDKKYLFLNSKIMETLSQLYEEGNQMRQEQNRSLRQNLIKQQEQIDRLKHQLQILQEKENKKEKQLQVIVEEVTPTKRVRTETQQSNTKKSNMLTLKDLKQPLQTMNSNGLATTKLHKTGLLKAKQKLKQGFKKDMGKLGTIGGLRRM